jgi:protein ImuA
MNTIAMKSLHRQQIFETLRSRFGVPAHHDGFGARARDADVRARFPEAILNAGLHECMGQGPGDWPSVVGFALLVAGRAPERSKPVFMLRLKNSLQELGEFYGHGFEAFGLDAAQLITIATKGEKDLLWAAEEIVASQAARAVIAALDDKEKLYGFTASRRLKLRTEGVSGAIFVLRHWSQGGATAAHSRWRITRLASGPDIKTPGSELLGAPRLSARLDYCRGAAASEWEIECHASPRFAMASLLADRASRTGAAPQRAA